jgi:hypothetical protein
MLQGVWIIGNSIADSAKTKHVGHLRVLKQRRSCVSDKVAKAQAFSG